MAAGTILVFILTPQKKNDIFNPAASWTLTNPITYYAPWIGTRNIINRMFIKEGMHILDAGCGPGRFTIPLALLTGPSGSVTAVDIQEEMISRVKARAQRKGLHNVKVLVVDLGAGGNKLMKSFYDFSLLVTVLGEIPEQSRIPALKEIRHSLRPGGMLSITEIESDPDHLSPENIRAMAREAGFEEYDFFSNRKSFTITLLKK